MLVVGALTFHRGSKRGSSFLIEIRRWHWGAEFWKLSEDGEVLGGRAVVDTTSCGIAEHRGWDVRRAARTGEDQPWHPSACSRLHHVVHRYAGELVGFPADS